MPEAAPDIAIYVGPTAVGLQSQPLMQSERFLILPPIARGDLPELPKCVRTVLIVDGYFGSRPSVSHLELLNALHRVEVVGCSSLGAIRAYELRDDGMIGIGQVYKAFFEHEDFMDDEVALLHAPEPYYWAVSVPLVDVRFALIDLQRRGVCTPHAASEVIAILKPLYFGDRTLEAVLNAAVTAGGSGLREALAAQLRHRPVKQADFLQALEFVLSEEVSTYDRGLHR